ncbi:MAG: DUF1553 domain-containing protein, partial [Rhodopirellula sp. JB044]|uniref:DUF1553 domain-containing protein n=1 Tax=Rhodopirellula sp. JB044 TaxID=3342844 RepID=UPI003709E6D9
WNDPARVKRIGDLPVESGWVRLQVPLKDRISPVAGQDFAAVGMAWLHTGGHVRWGNSGLNLRADKKTMLVLGETAMRKWWDAPYNRQVYERRFEYVAKAVKKDASKRNELQTEVAFAAFLEASRPDLMTELRRHESRLGRLRSQALPVLVSKRSDSRKTTRLLNRGDYLDETGPIVSPAVPEFFNNPIDADLPTRLDLANWLFDDENPLTARVYVNRLWHQFFGRGLSNTLDDSGTQGEWPSNHELLDWLACEFRDSGWDRDHMVRLLTSSRAYRLSSTPTETQLQNDPDNRLHARGARFRLPAETIRDTALQAAGLLTLTNEIPTRSVFPYQPNPYWTTSDKVMFGSRHLAWNTSREQTQYARSMYTFWKRQNIHPTMLAFDAPTRQECTAKRNITNTPGQALALLNDPIFVEAARVFASRIMQNAESNSDRLDHAFAVALQRPIRDDERVVLLQLLSTQVGVFTERPDDANALISIGQSPVPADVSPIELAAWTVVTRVILNLHEFLNRA